MASDPSTVVPGREPWDARGSSGNTMDLRGKILRVHPEPDGTISIPEGNLFSDATEGRPEIYVMGNRNPYRISIDQHTGFLYWGEVGPDAGENSPTRGPRGHDEVNQARRAGNFGWPLFVADNQAYHAHDFTTGKSGDAFDPAAPVNDSPNNTGARILPPAQPAFIWYPYAASEEFPIVGEGGRNAMAGPVYYADDYRDSPVKFPNYYDGKLFVYDWVRGWILVASMSEAGDLLRLEPFMGSTKFSNPIDMLFGPDGAMYLLEYGTKWFSQNPDARISRIEFTAGNRAPVARIASDRTLGAAPLNVAFSAAGSRDFDGDDLTYEWTFGQYETARGSETQHEFTAPGNHTVSLTVTDEEGKSATATSEILVGNDQPEVEIALNGNRTFFWPDKPVEYEVVVRDSEDGSVADGSIDLARVAVTFDYIAEGFDMTDQARDHESALAGAVVSQGLDLIRNSDCFACHQETERSIGPSYKEVAERYAGQEATDVLVERVIKGSNGQWGEQAMAAHPQHTEAEVSKMIGYILSVADAEETVNTIPVAGSLTFDQHEPSPVGRYILMATYTDEGTDEVGPLSGQDVLSLRLPTLSAARYDEAVGTTFMTVPDDPQAGPMAGVDILQGTHGSYAVYEGIDLTDVTSVTTTVVAPQPFTSGGTLHVRLDDPESEPVHSEVVAGGDMAPAQFDADLSAATGPHDLIFGFENEAEGGLAMFVISMQFSHE